MYLEVSNNVSLPAQVEYGSTIAEVHTLLARETATYRSKFRGPLITLLEGGAHAVLSASVPLLRDAPCCRVAPDPSAGEYPKTLWTATAVKAAFVRMGLWRGWLQERLIAARCEFATSVP